MTEKKKKLWEKILMGAVIGGAIGSVIGGSVGEKESEKAKEILKETTRPPRKLLRMIVGVFGRKKKEEDAKKIPHEDVK